MISRKQLVEEALLRKSIRNILGKIEKKRKTVNEQEQVLRTFIKKMLIQEVADADIDSTGISKLAAFLDEHTDTIKDGYKGLRTNIEQRTSYRDNMLVAIENLFDELDMLRTANKPLKEVIDLAVGEDEQEYYIEADPEKKKEEEAAAKEAEAEDEVTKEEEAFGVPESEPTGKKNAHDVFFNKGVRQSLVNYYNLLPTEEDLEKFKKWTLINLDMHLKNAEEELTGDKPEIPQVGAEDRVSPEAPQGTPEGLPPVGGEAMPPEGPPPEGLGLPPEEEEVIPPPSFE